MAQEPFESMTYRAFAGGYEISRDGPKEKQRLQRWKRTDGNTYIKKREKLQAVVPSPKFRSTPSANVARTTVLQAAAVGETATARACARRLRQTVGARVATGWQV